MLLTVTIMQVCLSTVSQSCLTLWQDIIYKTSKPTGFNHHKKNVSLNLLLGILEPLLVDV